MHQPDPVEPAPSTPAATARHVSDADALPVLVDVMAAAGTHDRSEVLRLLDAAEGYLPERQHKSRSDIEAAREAARSGEWGRVWTLAHQATCGLTYAFPPDPAACPPPPAAVPFAGDATCTECACALPLGARFCSACGQSTET